jgi:hypothetical protein
MDHADVFMKQLLMIRYNKLLDKIQAAYNVPDERMAVLRERIVNAQWVQLK